MRGSLVSGIECLLHTPCLLLSQFLANGIKSSHKYYQNASELWFSTRGPGILSGATELLQGVCNSIKTLSTVILIFLSLYIYLQSANTNSATRITIVSGRACKTIWS